MRSTYSDRLLNSVCNDVWNGFLEWILIAEKNGEKLWVLWFRGN